MNIPSYATADGSIRSPAPLADTPASVQTAASAVSWSAILAGAAAAAALALILLLLGTGLGMSVVSPWAHSGVSATTFGVASILWLTLTQVVASGLGGYLAGRLRTRWTDAHSDEVYFRDTAHGFLAWAISALTTAALLTSVIGSIIGSGVQAGAAVAGGAATSATAAAVAAGSDAAKPDSAQGPMSYFVDSLFRKDTSASSSRAGSGASADSSDASAATAAAEIARIFGNAKGTEALPVEDLRHVGHLVAQRTGLSQQEAEQRVNDTYARLQAKLHEAETAAREAADQARKASAYTALWLFISLLMGAFAASLSATWGGRRRDV
jgi:hypothetical protein